MTATANATRPAGWTAALKLLAERWPRAGQHHTVYQSLVGGLLRDGLTIERAEALVADLCEATSDAEPQGHVAAVADAARRLQDEDKKVRGWPTLAQVIGADAVKRCRVLLGTAADVESLARHKKLPVKFLRDLGLRDLDLGGVGVPYRDAGGKTVEVKDRRGLHGGSGRWPRGSRLLAYGEERLSDVPPGAPLVLVEGESDPWTLWFHGVHALGLPGADTVHKTLCLGHANGFRELLVVEEPGQGGKTFVANVRRRLAKLGWHGTLRVVRLGGVKDPSDLHCLGPDAFASKWQEAVAAAEPVALDAPPAPSDPGIPTEPPWPEPPAEEAFHGLAGKIVRTIEPASEADPAALLVQTLVAFGSIIGRSAHFTVEADRHHSNEFIVLVGRTSKARKGTSWGHVQRLMQQAEEQWASERVQSGLSSGEGLIWAVRDPICTQERVKEKGQPVHYEEVEKDPGVADKRLLVYEPEFANVLKQTERQGNTLSAILRQAWDGGDLRTLVKNSPARATGAHVSLIGHITADELRRYLTQTETGTGPLWRFRRLPRRLGAGQ
jgi:hypothetical protein